MTLNSDDRLLIRQFLEDLELLEQHSSGIGVTASILRQQVTPILRRWIVDSVLSRVQKVVGLRIEILVDDLRPFHRACENGRLWFFAGVKALVGNVPVSNFGFGTQTAESELPGSNPPPVRLKFADFQRQRVLIEKGVWAKREDVVKYVANKWGGVHIDSRIDTPIFKMLDHSRFYYGFKLEDGQLKWTVNHDGLFNIEARELPNDIIDLVLLSMLNTAQALCSSLGLIKQKASAMYGNANA